MRVSVRLVGISPSKFDAAAFIAGAAKAFGVEERHVLVDAPLSVARRQGDDTSLVVRFRVVSATQAVHASISAALQGPRPELLDELSDAGLAGITALEVVDAPVMMDRVAPSPPLPQPSVVGLSVADVSSAGGTCTAVSVAMGAFAQFLVR